MIELTKVTLSGDSESKLKAFLKNELLAMKDGLKELHEVRLPLWRKRYDAVPKEANRSFPFENASNLVVPVVAIHTDTLLARLMAGIFKVNPIWPVKLFGKFRDLERGDSCREALEQFLAFIASEPSHWDLYRVYREWLLECVKYGTSILKSPWLTKSIDKMATPGDGSGRFSPKFRTEVMYDGCRPEKLSFTDFLIPPASKTVEGAYIKVHRARLLKHELEERRFKQVYATEAVNKILAQPDRTNPLTQQQELERDSGVRTAAGYGYAEWDVYEVWCEYRLSPTLRTKIIASYHLASDTILRVLYNTYPCEVFTAARLFYEPDCFFGNGFAEILSHFQEEVSQQHNQRCDARTVANANFLRVAPDSKLHSGYKVYPGALVPADKDEVEPMRFGEPSELSIEDEQLTLDLAERRSGVSPPMQGAGAGSPNKKGVYSAIGTLSLLQEGNSRTDLNVSDIRYAHAKVGRSLALLQATFGREASVIDSFGQLADAIRMGLDGLRDGKLAIAVVPATASLNREVEKQSDVMMVGIMARHYQMVAGLLATAENPMTPPSIKEYVQQVIKSANELMSVVLRHFGYEEAERFVAEPKAPQAQPQQRPSLVAMPGGRPGQEQQQQLNPGMPGTPSIPA